MASVNGFLKQIPKNIINQTKMKNFKLINFAGALILAGIITMFAIAIFCGNGNVVAHFSILN